MSFKSGVRLDELVVDGLPTLAENYFDNTEAGIYRLEKRAVALLARPQLGHGCNALNVSPGTPGHLTQQVQLVFRPNPGDPVVDCHQCGKAALLHERHANGRGDADRLEGR